VLVAASRLCGYLPQPHIVDLEYHVPTLRKEDFDMFSPTVRYVENGYEFNETSPEWKEACRNLPCFSAIWWPDYSTEVIEETINGEPIVIQLWIGWCQKFLGRDDFPGGIGAEVGIYHRIPGQPPPSTIPFMPQKMADWMLARIADLGDEHLWWPYPELQTELEFEMVNPKTGETFFHAGPQKTYWLTKWMTTDSYDEYKKAQHGDTPWFSVNYNLRYKINGKVYEWT
jgi:hypothetical protein